LHRIHLHKENLKFSSAHMTVFPDGSKESLHGHNYSVEVTIDLRAVSLKEMISFSDFKSAIRTICQEWDEKVLLPQACPFLEIRSQTEQEIADEVILLPIDNVTAELLAQCFCQKFLSYFSKMQPLGVISGVAVRIDESTGQGSTFFYPSPIV
jgi:6-pyruvoyltetrahydropterin/6-carboxytetrahydropterin synthase